MKPVQQRLRVLQAVGLLLLMVMFMITQWGRWLAMVYFGIGQLLGLSGLWADEQWFHTYYSGSSLANTQGNDPDSTQNKAIPPMIATRSLLFVLALIPVSLFVVTSTGNTVGEGFVSALLLSLLFELWWFRSDLAACQQRFTPTARQPLTSREIRYGMGVLAVVSVVVIIKILF